MLTPVDLAGALTEALKAENGCRPWCRTGSEVVEGSYRCWHNGAGSGDSSDQTVYAGAVLSLGKDTFSARLVDWLKALHARRSFDINTGQVA